MKLCIICKERTSYCKNKCARCYYAVRKGSRSLFIRARESNFIKNGVYYLGNKFIVDKDDFEKFKYICWWQNGNGYARNNRIGYLHRAICPQFKWVDHINRDKLDNRKCNLREGIYLNSLNRVNKIPLPICQQKSGAWYGRVTVENKRYYITTNKNKNIVKEKVIKMLKHFNRLQFYSKI